MALPADHPLAGQPEVALAELLDEPFLALPASAGPLREHWLALPERAGARCGSRPRSPTREETYEALTAGLGVCLLAAGNATIFSRGGVVMRPVSDIGPSELVLAWRRDAAGPLLRAFVAACADVVGAAPPDSAQLAVAVRSRRRRRSGDLGVGRLRGRHGQDLGGQPRDEGVDGEPDAELGVGDQLAVEQLADVPGVDPAGVPGGGPDAATSRGFAAGRRGRRPARGPTAVNGVICRTSFGRGRPRGWPAMTTKEASAARSDTAVISREADVLVLEGLVVDPATAAARSSRRSCPARRPGASGSARGSCPPRWAATVLRSPPTRRPR